MITVQNDEKIKQILTFLKDKGLKRTAILGLALIFLVNSSSAVELDNKNFKEIKNARVEEFGNFKPTVDEFVEMPETEKITKPKILTNEEKISVILERENITREQFDIIVATVIGEAAPNSYDDAYAVINTFYNRKTSKVWINEMLRATGVDNGDNLYAQITLDNQSTVYTSGGYLKFLGITDVPGYQAVIDFLYTLESMHEFLCFYASFGDIPDSVQFVEGGNWYYSKMLESDRVEEVKLVRER